MRELWSSLRVRLILLVLMGVIPALGLTLYTGLEHRRHNAAEVQANALRLARLAAKDHEQLMSTTHQLLITLGQLPQVQTHDSAACSALFANILGQYTAYTGFLAVEPDGDVFCSAVPLAQPTNFADREWFQRVVQTRDFVVGEYLIGRISGKAVVVLAQPVLAPSPPANVGAEGADAEIQAMVVAALDLSWLNQRATEAELPPGSTLTVVDHHGTVLARYPDAESWVGRTAPDTPIMEAIMTQGEGTAEVRGVDGVPRLYAFVPLGGAPQGSVYVKVGIPTAVAYAEANRGMIRNLILLGLVTLLAFAAAWVGGDLFILRQTRALLRATQRLEAGDLEARTNLPYGQGELGQLARAFDQMAHALQQRAQERKQTQEALRAYAARLEQSNRDLQEFAYVASHDLQEPLRKILAFGDRLATKYEDVLDDRGRDYLHRMQSASQRMSDLINSLLTFSRVQTRGQPFTAVDLTELAQRVVSDLELQIERTDGQVELTDLPTIEADQTQIRQLLQNLISNALKFHHDDRPPVIKVYQASGASKNSKVSIAVEDNGIGFDMQFSDRIFKPFQRLHGRGDYEGTGMGLAICRRIVERHDGSITVQSKPDEGTTFTVTLPVKQEARKQSTVSSEQ